MIGVLHGFDWLVICAYLILITFIGWRANRTVASSGDYFMGGRTFGRLKMIAQAFGSGTRTDQAVAVIGASSQMGLAGIWYQWLYLFSTPFFWIIAPVYRRMRYLTIGDFFHQRYGTGLGVTYTVVGLLYFSMNIGIILKGTAVTIQGITGNSLSQEVIVLFLMLFFITYGLLGGLKAAVNTQFIQGLFILILSFLLIPFALSAAGGFSGVKSRLPETIMQQGEVVKTDWFSLVANTEITFLFICMAVINALVGVVVQPHHMAINGAGKDEISCRSGWTYGTFIKRLATLGWAFTGILIVALYPNFSKATESAREAAFGLAIIELLPHGLVGLMIAAMIAAAVSACNSFMINGGTLFTRNSWQQFVRPDAGEKEMILVGRASSLVVVLTGVAVALMVPSVIDGLKWIWKIMAFMGISFWMAIFWRKANRWGAYASVICTSGIAIGTQLLGWGFTEQVLLYLPVGFLVMIVVSALTPAEPKRVLDTFYSLLNTPVGHENRLREAGIAIIHEKETSGQNKTNAQTIQFLDDNPARKSGERLVLVHLLRLFREFTYREFKVDINGFAISWGLVVLFLGLAALLSWAGSV